MQIGDIVRLKKDVHLYGSMFQKLSGKYGVIIHIMGNHIQLKMLEESDGWTCFIKMDNVETICK